VKFSRAKFSNYAVHLRCAKTFVHARKAMSQAWRVMLRQFSKKTFLWQEYLPLCVFDERSDPIEDDVTFTGISNEVSISNFYQRKEIEKSLVRHPITTNSINKTYERFSFHTILQCQIITPRIYDQFTFHPIYRELRLIFVLFVFCK
jgi:hypothetical protein